VDERNRRAKVGVVDGDLVMLFLELGREEKERVAERVGVSVEVVQSIVEDVAIVY
jgi:hypothetical protein